ncbi:MAG: DUF6456 domain-containing protein [Hyphomicrobiales bacterium]
MSDNNKENIKLLKKLAGGNRVSKPNLKLGNERIENIIKNLKRLDLVDGDKDGDIKITREGRAFLKRALCTNDDSYGSQHRDLCEVGDDEKIVVNLSESPLSRLYSRRSRNGKRIIQDHQFRAGERLRRDFEAAQLSPKLGLSIAPKVDGGRGGGDASYALDGAMAARDRVDQALRFVGNEMNSLLLDVCCFLKGLECIERERQWPVRSAKIVLSLALERLATHYGFSEVATGAPLGKKGHSQVWHAKEA